MLRRAEFVQASRRGRAVATPFFIVQSVPDAAPDFSRRAHPTTANNTTAQPTTATTTSMTTTSMTLGVTASRKVGNAVARNRAKRRLRALLYQTLLYQNLLANPVRSPPSRRIVVVARKACVDADFATMRLQLEQALKRSKERTP